MRGKLLRVEGVATPHTPELLRGSLPPTPTPFPPTPHPTYTSPPDYLPGCSYSDRRHGTFQGGMTYRNEKYERNAVVFVEQTVWSRYFARKG